MPLNETVMATMMKANMDALSDEEKADPAKSYEALAKAVIDHLKAAGVITVPALGLISATPGAPVTGVAVGTIT